MVQPCARSLFKVGRVCQLNNCTPSAQPSTTVLRVSDSGFEHRYFFAFFEVFVFASARRSVFLRRAARFLTLSLPWLFPIRPSTSTSFPSGSK